MGTTKESQPSSLSRTVKRGAGRRTKPQNEEPPGQNAAQADKPQNDTFLLPRVSYSVSEICFRNGISVPTYRRLKSMGLGPVEMRFGLNLVRVTAEAERDWLQQMQEPRPDLEARATKRAMKAGDAAVRSDKHVSKRRRVTP